MKVCAAQLSASLAAYLPNAREIVSPDHVLAPLEPLDSVPLRLPLAHRLEEREGHGLRRETKSELFKVKALLSRTNPFRSVSLPSVSQSIETSIYIAINPMVCAPPQSLPHHFL